MKLKGMLFLLTVIVSGSLMAKICDTNDYALCSHANCVCLDEFGKEGPCEAFDFKQQDNPDQPKLKGWARCTCPVVKNTLGNVAYNSNFTTLDCDTLAEPQTSDQGNPFPEFVYLRKQNPQVYSTYSYGDSLNNDQFGTLNNASLMVCDQPKLMTLCLDMPCTVNENGDTADCYCQNAPVAPAKDCKNNGRCTQTVWNTLGGGCDRQQCDPGEHRVWSAAYLPQTLEGINDLYNHISSEVPGFSDLASYCTND